MRQVCIACIKLGEKPVCKQCMVRGVTPGWEALPKCCKGCNYIDENGHCAVPGDLSRIKDDSCGIRSQPKNIVDWSKIREGGEADAEHHQESG